MKKFLALAASSLIALPVYAATPATSTQAKAADFVATVNGDQITAEQFKIGMNQAFAQGQKDSAALRQHVLNVLINQTLIAQQAEKDGLAKLPAVEAMLKNAKSQVLMNEQLDSYVAKNPPTDAQVKKYYDDLVAANKDKKEYKVRHILVKDEATAKKLLADLKKKRISFEKAAEKNSIDPGTAKQGGELGWNLAASYVPDFAKAVEKAKKGELIPEPVKSQFGYHIIQVQDERAVKMPSLKDLEGQIKNVLIQQEIGKYVDSLRKASKIEVTPSPEEKKK